MFNPLSIGSHCEYIASIESSSCKQVTKKTLQVQHDPAAQTKPGFEFVVPSIKAPYMHQLLNHVISMQIYCLLHFDVCLDYIVHFYLCKSAAIER